MRVMKVGIVKKGDENDDNKGLVWIGYPANFASRLTDCANKEFVDITYKVDADFYYKNYFEGSPYWKRATGWYRETKEFTSEELAESLRVQQNGLRTTLASSKFINVQSVQRVENKHTYPSILLSEAVFNGYKKEQPNGIDIEKEWWKEQARRIRDIDFKVLGADFFWVFS